MGGNLTRLRGEMTKPKIMPINANEVFILDSNQGTEEKMGHQKIQGSKISKKVESKYNNKISLIAKLDVVSFCLFSFGYVVFNCHYWMKYYLE